MYIINSIRHISDTIYYIHVWYYLLYTFWFLHIEIYMYTTHGGDWVSSSNGIPVKWLGLPFTPQKHFFEILGTPWKPIRKLRGLPRKLVEILAFEIIQCLLSSAHGADEGLCRLLKIVGFAKEPYKIDYILQKRPITILQMRDYGVATISRLLKIIGLFCKRAL